MIIRPLRDSLGKLFRRPHEQCQIVKQMKDGNEGLGGGSCSKRTPIHLQHQCLCTAARQGRGSSVARQGWREDSDSGKPQPWLLCLHISCSRHRSSRLLAVQVLLASLAFPTPSFLLFHQPSLVLLSKGRGLASVPWLWRQLLANLQVPAVSHLQPSFHTQG